MSTANGNRLLICTIGHSTRTLDELVDILRAHGVEHLVDIRRIPRSRTNPQFNGDVLPEQLARYGIEYSHLEALSGLRRGPLSSLNDAWRNRSFRAFADYMQTADFADGIDALIGIAKESPTAIMCAEAVPWRCHRSLVADALVVRGITVHHLMSTTVYQVHTLRDFARVDGTTITYPSTPE